MRSIPTAALALLAAPALAQPVPTPTIQSLYDATPSGGIITIPAGAWPSGPWFTPYAPPKTPGKTVLWNFTTPTPPGGAVGDNDVTESFTGGHVNFLRNVLTGNPGGPTLFVTLDDLSRGYQLIHYGNGSSEYPDVPALQVNAATHPGSLGQVNGIEINIASQGHNGYVSEDQGLNINVEKSGSNSTWALSTLTNDTSGRPPGAFASIAAEYDIYANGPDDPASLANPLKANRIFLWLVGKISPVAPWSANQRIAKGGRVLARVDGIPTVFVATAAGLTGAAAPAWPASGAVQDGGVAWTYGEPYAVTYGRGIALDAQAGQQVGFSTGFSSNAGFANAVIDLSTARLLRPNAAAIRLAPGMPLDFSAAATAASQNRHTLAYTPDTPTPGLTYAAASHPILSITDAGHLATTGPAPALTACGTNPATSATATDRHGTVTPGPAATSCTVTFAQPYATPPDCLLTGWTATPPALGAVTATSFTVAARGKFTYLCEQ